MLRVSLKSLFAHKIRFALTNAFAETGQHFELVPAATSGWSVDFDGPRAVSLDGGATGDVVLDVTVDPTATAPLPIAIVSDVGGREWRFIGVDGQTFVVGNDAATPVAPMEPSDDSPGPGAILLIALAGSALLIRRRR